MLRPAARALADRRAATPRLNPRTEPAMETTDTSPEADDGYAEWQQRHQRASAAILADARQQLQAALGQIIAARSELSAAHGAWRDCDGECTACIGPTAQQDVEAFIADAERSLRAAQALTRPSA